MVRMTRPHYALLVYVQLGFGEVGHVGCCALAATVSRTHVVVANAGDCRAVIGRVMSDADSVAVPEERLSPFLGGATIPTVRVAPPPPADGSAMEADLRAVAAARGVAALVEAPRGGGPSRAGHTASGAPPRVVTVALSEDHNARMPREQEAMRKAHPSEVDVVVRASV